MKDIMSISEQKKNIRKKVRYSLREFAKNHEIKMQYDRNIIDTLMESDEYKKSHNVFCYVGMDDEIDTSIFIKKALEDGKNISVPRITGKITMDAVSIESIDELIPISPYGILEPQDSGNIMDEIDLIIVPGIAFDVRGGRVGHGAGYYDYFIKRHREASTIALCYDFQIVNNVPEEEHDIRIQKIIFKDDKKI